MVQDHARDIRHCYEVELQASPKLAGKLSVTFVIGADGKVTGATVEKTELPAPLVECVRGLALKFEFPPPKGGGVVKVTYPFVFTQHPAPPR